MSGVVIYPCDYGTGTPQGMHRFEATAYGVCCRHCGARPKPQSNRVTHTEGNEK